MAVSEIIALDQTPLDPPALPIDHIDHEAFADVDIALLGQVDRILRSEEFRSSEGLHRLLKFLAKKSIFGEADELKEYTIAIEGLGKPSSYDPRHKSTVRIQVGRLRQKLANYYRTEGQQDRVVIDVPKGRFKLTCEFRDFQTSGTPPSNSSPTVQGASVKLTGKGSFIDVLKGMRFSAGLAIGLVIAIAAAASLRWMKPLQANTKSTSSISSWDPEMEDLWQPFIATSRPLVVAIEDPLFVELDVTKGVYYRDRTLDNWNEIVSSPTVKAIRAAGGERAMKSSRAATTPPLARSTPPS